MAMDGYDRRVISYPTFTELSNILTQWFDILHNVLEHGMPTFIVKWREDHVPSKERQREVFDELDARADALNSWALVRWRNKELGEYYIRFVPIETQEKSDSTTNYILFIATLATMGIGGFLQATSPVFLTLFYPRGWNLFDVFLTTIIFMASIMGIIFTHEMGHYLTAQNRGIEATLPYFIPGLPELGGTFGAFIQQKSPPKTLRDLYDLGVAGPLAGFAVTLVVLLTGFFLSVPVTAEQLVAIENAFPNMTGSLPVPYIFVLLEMLFQDSIPAGGTIYLHPVAFAGWVGCLVTALNLFPASQLDGGHALRAVVDSEQHKYIGYAAIALMFLLGFFLMAILVFLLSRGGEHPGPLNDTIPISNGRKLVFVLAMIILILSIPPLGFSFF
ncbi:MAG: conserved membrane protein of unknown function [Candidatus Thorarchaeota archaeon]|nr:MAG: conserved membrane protein of unknown function [Candidatus Thorarchaeota archaeon]